jgi:glycosyltransferase involved in cell wall biosynthesis
MIPDLKIIVNCGPCEDYIAACLGSLVAQSFQRWEAFVTVDACQDRTYELAAAAAGGDSRIYVRKNTERLYAMRNLIAGVDRSGANPEDVIVVLDGDDWLATSEALSIVASTYNRTGCWMTYGSWISNDATHEGMPRGLWPAYPDGETRFRETVWLGTALRTWKKWLWDLIDPRDFLDRDGRFLRVTEDQAAMLPMIEMSGTERARHIPDVLMVYNRTTPHACGKVAYGEMTSNAAWLRTKPPYAKLKERPVAAPISVAYSRT